MVERTLGQTVRTTGWPRSRPVKRIRQVHGPPRAGPAGHPHRVARSKAAPPPSKHRPPPIKEPPPHELLPVHRLADEGPPDRAAQAVEGVTWTRPRDERPPRPWSRRHPPGRAVGPPRGPWRVSVSGHSNPDHGPEGWANEFITVTVHAVPGEHHMTTPRPTQGRRRRSRRQPSVAASPGHARRQALSLDGASGIWTVVARRRHRRRASASWPPNKPAAVVTSLAEMFAHRHPEHGGHPAVLRLRPPAARAAGRQPAVRRPRPARW